MEEDLREADSHLAFHKFTWISRNPNAHRRAQKSLRDILCPEAQKSLSHTHKQFTITYIFIYIIFYLLSVPWKIQDGADSRN
jgi:hypothetical protein